MTAYTWGVGTGNWKAASNWLPSGGPPTATDTATIGATGLAYTVTINSAQKAQSLTESSASATVDDKGSLTLGATFTLSAGTFILDSGGTLSGGTTLLAGGTFACEGGTLSGVTYDGTLDLSGSGASVHLACGTVVNDTAGTGAGTINDTGDGSSLSFDNTQTFNNATINLGNASSYSYLSENDSTGAGTVLTLGSGVTINESGYAVIETGDASGDGIVNQGAITQSGTSSYLQINGKGSLTNSGTITAASSSGALIIDNTTFTNSGTLVISNGDAVTIGATNWSNTGSITLASGSSLYLGSFNFGGSFTLAELGTVSNSGGTVYIQGTLDNTGGTLNGSSGLGQAVLYGGTVQGGAATPSGLILSLWGGTLSGVTYNGTLDLSNASVHLADGTVVNNASGNGAGTINDNGGTLSFDHTQTFNNATINLSGALYEDDTTGGGILTLGSGVAIDAIGFAYICTGYNSGDGIVNQGAINQSGTSSYLFIYGNGALTNNGTITAASSGGALIIDTTTFTNSGTLAVSDGDTVMIESTTFTNLAAYTLIAGTYEAEAGSTLVVDSDDTITTDDADIILSGAESTIETYNTGTGVTDTIDTTLCTIGASGELQLLASRNWTTAGAAITNDGLIQLGGGTLTSTASGASLTDTAGSRMRGFGTVTVTSFTNSGTIEASGGTLTLTEAVGGTGGLQIDAGANLILAATAATTNVATFNGPGATLTLDHVGNLTGAIGGVGLDDAFHLVGVTANGATVNGSNQLVVTENGTTVDTLQLSGNNTGYYFLPVAVSGGTDIVSLPIPATVADYHAVQSLYDQIPSGFAISDTAANISANLNSLNDPRINSITISDTAADVAVHVGALNGERRLTLIAISDTAADLAANLDALNGSSHAMSIALTDNGVPALKLSVAQALNDTTALGDIATPYTVSISDTAADVAASFDALNADTHVTSIALTEAGIPTLVLTASQYANDTKALDEIAMPYAVVISNNGVIGVPIATNGVTTLAQVDSHYELEAVSGGTGPLIALNGIAVTVGQFPAGWTPVGAKETEDGYEVAWSVPGKNEYVIWNTDANGNFTGAATEILSGASYALEALEVTFREDLNSDGTVGPTMAAIATNNTTTLTEVANQFELNPAGGGIGPFLKLNGSPVTVGEFPAGWTPVGAVQSGDGYEVAFCEPVSGQSGQKHYVVWNTDANGNFTGAATGILSGASYALEALEATFGEDLNSDGTVGPTMTVIATNSTTTLTEVANQLELNSARGGTGPFLELNGSPVTAGQFPAGWAPVGAMQTARGYEVAFSAPVPGQYGQKQYVVWNTDGNGDYTSAATGVLSGTSYALEQLEATFGEDLNRDGTVGPTMAAIATNSTTTLTEVANQFELNPAGGGTGPFLKLNGSPVTATQFPAGWTPVGAVERGDGYEVAFRNRAKQYVVWNTDVNGNFTSAATGILSETSAALEAIAANFGETFPGETFFGAGPPASTTLIATNGTTTLAQVGNLFELNPAGGGTGPLLELNGSVVAAGQFPAGWTPVGAEQTASGYEVAWSVPGKNEYAIWNIDSNGNFTSGEAGVTPGAPAALWTINTNGATSLVQVGNHYELEAVSTGTGPLIELSGSAVTPGQFPAGWTPVGAEQTATGYEVAWSILGANEFVVWNTDSNGDYTSNATGILSGASPELEAVEAAFGEQFPGAGPPASPGTAASTVVTGIHATTALGIGATVSNNGTVDFADLPSGCPSAVDLIDPSGFSGKIENFASPDSVNLSGDWNYLHFTENSGATLGTLTLENATSHADFSLKFVGDYARSDFHITSGTTTTIAHT